MSDLKITTGIAYAEIEILAAGTVILAGQTRPFSFTYGDASLTVNPILEVPPKGPQGHFLLPLPAGALMPGGDASHNLGEAYVYVQMRKLARAPGSFGPEEFLFSYEVTRPTAAPQLRSAA